MAVWEKFLNYYFLVPGVLRILLCCANHVRKLLLAHTPNMGSESTRPVQAWRSPVGLLLWNHHDRGCSGHQVLQNLSIWKVLISKNSLWKASKKSSNPLFMHLSSLYMKGSLENSVVTRERGWERLITFCLGPHYLLCSCFLVGSSHSTSS